ncbi:MAG: DUF1573 domain-containing protein [Planctomycetota bacterium]
MHLERFVVTIGLLAALRLGLTVLGACGRDSGRRLAVEPASLDFGHVLRGDRTTRTLTLRNEGRQPVFISAVKPNCVCFSVAPFERSLQPGDVREVRITLSSGLVPPERLRGKKVEIFSDDPVEPQRSVALEGDVYQPFVVVPERIELGRLAGEGRAKVWKVRVRPREGYEARVSRSAISPPDLFRVETEMDGGDTVLALYLEPNARGDGHLKATMAIDVLAAGEGLPQRSIVSRVLLEGDW